MFFTHSNIGISNIVISAKISEEKYRLIKSILIKSKIPHLCTNNTIISSYFSKEGICGITPILSRDKYGYFFRITVYPQSLINNAPINYEPYIYSNQSAERLMNQINSCVKQLKMNISYFYVTRIGLCADYCFENGEITEQYLQLAHNAVYSQKSVHHSLVNDKDIRHSVAWINGKSELEFSDRNYRYTRNEKASTDLWGDTLRIEAVFHRMHINEFTKKFYGDHNISINEAIKCYAENAGELMLKIIDKLYPKGDYYSKDIVDINIEELKINDEDKINLCDMVKATDFMRRAEILMQSQVLKRERLKTLLNLLNKMNLNPVAIPNRIGIKFLYSFRNLIEFASGKSQ